MSDFLTVSSQLMCPHGGMVSIVSENTAVLAGDDPVARMTDTFLVAGCPFMAGPSPHPCMQVQWLVACVENQVEQGDPVTDASVGLCTAADQAPQGPPQVVTTQVEAEGT